MQKTVSPMLAGTAASFGSIWLYGALLIKPQKAKDQFKWKQKQSHLYRLYFRSTTRNWMSVGPNRKTETTETFQKEFVKYSRGSQHQVQGLLSSYARSFNIIRHAWLLEEIWGCVKYTGKVNRKGKRIKLKLMDIFQFGSQNGLRWLSETPRMSALL